MNKLVAAGVIAFALAPLSVGHSQTRMGQPGANLVSATDLGAFTEARIDLLKSALQLTPDQEKYWPAIEQAIQSRSKQRIARLETARADVSGMKDEGVMEALRNANPVEFLNRRADALAQRAASLKQLAGAWKPLYETLAPEQKRRLALLTIYAVHEMRDAVQQHRIEVMDEDNE